MMYEGGTIAENRRTSARYDCSETAPVYGVAQHLAPGLRCVLARNPGPYTYHGTNTYIVGEGSVAVIDPGPALEEHIDAVLAAVAGEVVSHIVVTHTHRDHSPAAHALGRITGAPTLGFGPHPTGCPEHGGGAPVENGPDLCFDPDIRLADGDAIEGRDWSLTAVHTPGHMSNLMCYAWPETGILFSGDHVMAWASSVISPPDGDLTDYLDSLEKVARRPETMYLPSHGPGIQDPQTAVRGHIDHRRARTDQILATLRDGPATVESLVRRVYPSLRSDLLEGAGCTVLAHLVDLRRKGRVAQCGSVWRAL